MEPHQLRVVEERDKLKERLGKLHAFYGTTVFLNLDSDERRRLDNQVSAMAMYLDALNERIAAFK